MVDHQLGYHAKAAIMRGAHKAFRIAQRTIIRMDAAIFADVVAVITQWTWVKRQQPYRVDPELDDIVKFLQQAVKVADAIVVAIEEAFHVQLIDDRVAIPFRVTASRPGMDRGPHGLRPEFQGRTIHAGNSRGRARQTPNGSDRGSRLMVLCLPCHSSVPPFIRSVTSRSASS